MVVVLCDVGDGDLMSSPETFQVMPAYFTRSRPSLGGTEDDHGPSRSERLSGIACLFLILSDLDHTLFKSGGHGLMHRVEIGTFDKVGGPTVPFEQAFEFFVRYSSEDGGVVDLVTVDVEYEVVRVGQISIGCKWGGRRKYDDSPVQVQYGKDGTVSDRVQELVAVPSSRQWSRLALPIADHGERDQIRSIEDGPEGMTDRVS
jgi:hypothetical protein